MLKSSVIIFADNFAELQSISTSDPLALTLDNLLFYYNDINGEGWTAIDNGGATGGVKTSLTQAQLFDRVSEFFAVEQVAISEESELLFNIIFPEVPEVEANAQETQVLITPLTAANQNALLEIAVAKFALVRKIVASNPCRIRAYSTSAYRLADIARPIGNESNSYTRQGLLLEVVTTNDSLVIDATEAAQLFNADNPATNIIYWTIQNLDVVDRAISVTITKLNLES